MKFLREKVIVDKVLWKELLLGLIDAFIWCTILFILICGFSEEIIEILDFVTDNTSNVLTLYWTILPIFIAIAIVIKLLYFVLKYDSSKDGTPRRRRTTTSKKTTKRTTKK